MKSSSVTQFKLAADNMKLAERKIRASMPLAEQVETLQHLIKNPPSNSRVIEYSPKLAEQILASLNMGNRPLKPGKIKDYAADMTKGQWGLTGDSIKFGTDGNLKDGQNRLAACVRAGKPFSSHTVFGIEPQLFARMDIGKNRTGGDVFAIAGIRYAGHASNTVRWLLILGGENPSDRGAQFSNEELLRAYREDFDPERIERSIHSALAVRRTCHHPVAPLAALHYLFSERNAKAADAFFDEWATGRGKRVRAPARFLQTRLQKLAQDSNNRIHENIRNALIIKAWNAYVAGRTLTKAAMQHALSDKFPKIAG